MNPKTLTIEIPYGIATDVINTLNHAGYVLFARPDQKVTVTATAKASEIAIAERAERIFSRIKETGGAETDISQLVETFIEACEQFGPMHSVSKEIGKLLIKTEEFSLGTIRTDS